MKKIFLLLAAACVTLSAAADEGMWMLPYLQKMNSKDMKARGCKLSAEEIYSMNNSSLKDAIVIFGGGCTGEIVSPDGLLFTNHHCGYGSIQSLSSVEHDYLKNGFWAMSRAEELPAPGLKVRFIRRIVDVTPDVLGAVPDIAGGGEREELVAGQVKAVSERLAGENPGMDVEIKSFFGGNQYFAFVIEVFRDVRLVGAPPTSIGKFGGDTDNWMWPRHTGDFSVFRIYANAKNGPADYSPENVPYHPEYVAPISLDGYKEGSFCMTLGYPGSTERYLSSYGIEEMMNGINQAMIDVRGVKQTIWKREMDRRPDIRIKYASKYDESSNYWKNSIGTNKAIKHLKVLEKKRVAEAELRNWIQSHPEEREKLIRLFSSLELSYSNRRETNRALAYFGESFINGPELVQLALEILNFDFEAEEKLVITRMKKLLEKYDNLDLSIDKEVFAAMLKEYQSKVDKKFLPAMYEKIDTLYNGNIQTYVDSLYATSNITSPKGLKRFLERDTTYNLIEDPAVSLSLDLIVKYYEMNQSISEASEQIEEGERLFNAAMRRMYADRNFYPDANSTMRLSFGTVGGYTPFDGATYDYYTTVKGIFEKVKEHAGDIDFAVQPELLSLLSSGDFGRYANAQGDMNVCFISNNDITGGNSGSAMFNAKGELLGLAFDGNWEAMSSDIVFEPDLQRCIGVDVRYMLFIIEKYGKAAHLIQELKMGR